MKKKNLFLVAAIASAVAALGFGVSAASAATFTVDPTLSPNAFGSPSYAAFVNNVNQAHDLGLTSNGPAGPTQYNSQGNVVNVTAKQGIVTGFSSWMGVADPGGAYAGELGNRMSFSFLLNGDGHKVSINNLSFSATSSDAGNVLGFGFAQGSYNYSNDYEGVLFGADGMLGGGDDVFITSGASNQLVDAIVGRGSGNSLAATCADGPCATTAERQALIDNAASYFTDPVTTFKGTYTLHGGPYTGPDVFGSGQFNIASSVGAVPEPSSWALMILGFGGVGATLRRRRQSASLATA